MNSIKLLDPRLVSLSLECLVASEYPGNCGVYVRVSSSFRAITEQGFRRAAGDCMIMRDNTVYIED